MLFGNDFSSLSVSEYLKGKSRNNGAGPYDYIFEFNSA